MITIDVQLRVHRTALVGLPAVLVNQATLDLLGADYRQYALVSASQGPPQRLWLAAPGRIHEGLFDEADPATPVALIDPRSASLLGMSSEHEHSGRISAANVRLEVQPTRLDDPVRVAEVIVGAVALQALGYPRHVIVASELATMCAQVRTSNDLVPAQDDSKIRLNFHARALLGLRQEAGAGRPNVTVSAIPRGADMRTPWRIGALIHAAGRLVGRWLLGAPTVAVAARRSPSGDDEAGVVRLAGATLDLLGVESGDLVLVGWDRRTVRTRAFLAESDSTEDLSTAIIVQDTILDPQLSSRELIATVPSGVRNRLGAPAGAVFTINRSIYGLARKRVVGLTIPLGGVAISVAQLGLEIWAGALIFLASAVLTLAGDRVSAVHHTTWRVRRMVRRARRRAGAGSPA